MPANDAMLRYYRCIIEVFATLNVCVRINDNTLKMHLQIQAKVTPINVPIYELPEFICVETQWITQEYAKKHNMEGLLKIPHTTDDMINLCTVENSSSLQERAPVIHCGTMTTDETAPRCSRLSQTEVSTADASVQCEMDEEEIELPDQLDESDPQEAVMCEAKFLSYVSDSTSMFPNGMLECLRCGEIALTLQEHQYHMSKHHGPSTLCHRCGCQIEDHSLIKHHSFSCAARTFKRATLGLKCPHLLCNVLASTHEQLNHHMRRHKSVNYYRCSKCRRAFTTAVGFLFHRKTVAACHKGKPIRLSRSHAQSARISDVARCSICLTTFSKVRLCVKHAKYCERRYHFRLEKILRKKISS